jgi:pimeloyl-ACP methyl ester carboxylesterase
MQRVVYSLCVRIKHLLVLCLLAGAAATPAQVPAAVSSDPPADPTHPAKMTVLHIPSHGLLINGVAYHPSGAGLHPTLVICHGLPGNEKNLDLAQAVRRAGWNAITFNYRGSWGSPGNFRFAQNLEDAPAVLAYLRDPVNAAKLGIDTRRIVLAGHSMGGWVVAHTAAKDPALLGAILISAADMSRSADSPRDRAVAMMADNMEALAGVTAESMADEVRANAQSFRLENAIPGLVSMPLLVITSDDGLAPAAKALVAAIEAKGGKKVATKHFATDHSYSDRRIALEGEIITWLGGLH